MALSSGKFATRGSAAGFLSLGVIAAAAIYQGGMAMLAAGNARAARAGQGANDFAKINDIAMDRVVGTSIESVVGGGADGAVQVQAESGDWLQKNSAGVDAITAAEIGRYCFVVDDETVAKTSAGGTRPRAGVVIAVDATGVMVRMAPEIAAAAPRIVHLPFQISETDTLAGTSAELVSPVAGTIARMTVIVAKAVTTGGDVTATVDATTVAGLACTIADGAAKGAIVTDTPTAGDASTVVAAGQRIQIVPAAAFATAGAVSGILEIAY